MLRQSGYRNGVVLALLCGGLALGCADSSTLAPDGNRSMAVKAGASAIESGPDAQARELATLRAIAADPEQLSHFYAGMTSQPHATLADLIAVLESSERGAKVGASLALHTDATVDSESTPGIGTACFTLSDNTPFCAVGYSKIADNLPPPNSGRTATFGAGTICTYGTHCVPPPGAYAFLGGTMDVKYGVSPLFYSKSFAFQGNAPTAFVQFSLTLYSGAWQGSMSTDHWFSYAAYTNNFGTSAAAGSI